MDPVEEFNEDETAEGSPESHGAYEVTLPSGSKAHVMTEEERSYAEERTHRYTTEYAFSSISDLQDVDRVIMMELADWRYNRWQTHGIDYNGELVDSEEIQKAILDISKEVRQCKKMLGIDKAARDRQKGESVSEYLDSLRFRARQFGVMREEQLTKALTLFNELQALIAYNENCTQEEARENGVTIPDILKWLNEVAFPEFREIDEYFQKNQQSTWIRKQ